MKKNMGTFDRSVRVLIALIISGLYGFNIISGSVAIVLIVLASVFILTSFISVCPLYIPLGINTCKDKKD